MVDDPNKTESGSFIDDDYLTADEQPVTSTPAQKLNFKEIWAQNPSLKIFAIVAGIAFLLITYMVFGGSSADKPNPDEDFSAVRATPDVTQTPGTAELPPAYEEAVRQSNEQTLKNAEATGDSAIPTPIARPSERIEAPVQVEENDPLSEWRREAENRRIERQQQDDAIKAEQEQALAPPSLPVTQTGDPNIAAAAPQNPPLPTTPSTEQIQAYTQQIMQSLQSQVLESQVPKESVVISMNIQPAYNMDKYFPPQGTTTAANANGQTTIGPNGQAVTTPAAAQNTQPKPIIAAGSIAYAQIITEANSDVPGPVLAEVASGPLLGGRAIGTFQVAEKRLVLQFNRIVKDGVEYQVQAYALDPATTLPGVVSTVNNHYFSRIFLPAAAAFIEGFADAATQTDTNVVVSNGTVVTNSQNELDTRKELLKGAREAGSKLSEIVDEDADRPRTVIVHSGTRIGLLFMNSIYDPATQLGTTNYANNLQQGQQGYGQAAFNASPYGQAYNAYQNYQYQQNGQQGQTGYGNTNMQQGQPAGLYSSQTSANTGRIQPF